MREVLNFCLNFVIAVYWIGKEIISGIVRWSRYLMKYALKTKGKR